MCPSATGIGSVRTPSPAPSCSAAFELPAHCPLSTSSEVPRLISWLLYLELGFPQWSWDLEVLPCPPPPTFTFTHKYFPDLYNNFTIFFFQTNKHTPRLTIPDCPRTGYVDQAGLNLQRFICCLCSLILELKVYTTIPSNCVKVGCVLCVCLFAFECV